MAEGFYRVKVPEDAKTALVEGKDTLVVSAETSAEAILIAKAYLHLPSDAAWAASTPVLLAHVTDLEGWRMRVLIRDPADDSIVEDVTVTAGSADDFDAIGDLMVIALNATDSIGAAAYSTPNLIIADGGGVDDLGDMAVEVFFMPPITWDDPTIDFDEFYNTIVDEGASNADLTVVLVDVIAPTVLYELGSGS
jgi:hypothetical protein